MMYIKIETQPQHQAPGADAPCPTSPPGGHLATEVSHAAASILASAPAPSPTASRGRAWRVLAYRFASNDGAVQ